MKVIKWIAIVIAVFGLLFYFVGMPYLREQTKKNSPQKSAAYTQNGFDLKVDYSSPFKKGRVIFGELVPYNKVWRTGANEPTTFTTGTDIAVIDKKLAAGTYSVWTEPKPESWSVIFNSEVPDWGVTLSSGGQETTRNPEKDVIRVEVPVSVMPSPLESFTIGFEEDMGQVYLSFSWDTTKVRVPLNTYD
jgi:hypothetical protein